MAPLPLSQRVTMLEQRVDRLETLPDEIAAFREEVRGRFDQVDQRFDLADGKVDEMVKALLERIDEGNRRTTVLYEDLVNRIAVLGERWNGQAP